MTDHGNPAHRDQRQRAGFDDALLTGPGAVIAESAIANIGFFDGSTVIWPDAPALAGITMQLVTRVLAERGMPPATTRCASLTCPRSGLSS